MTIIRAVTEADLPLEEQRTITEALKMWKSGGNPDPRIPIDVDLDGDGKTDAYGLDGFGRLVYVSGVALEDTVFTTEGTGFEAQGAEDA